MQLIPIPDRIHILGAAGSGKTILAQNLSQTLSVPWYELDTVAYENDHGRNDKSTSS